MAKIKDLNKLLKSIDPRLIKGEYVFCTLSKNKYSKLNLNPLMFFNEKEGITLILKKDLADKNDLFYEKVWRLITLNVHSDLSAVGFLAEITKKLASSNISVNAVSAYYHDHIFVPSEKSKEALKLLRHLSYSSN
ncbi:MAG: ACT domain-containing protein [Candidatus Omnitrophica bacterium]|nr:ACT domain-containing protein [Candidatus Omnitrophota bacterium]